MTVVVRELIKKGVKFSISEPSDWKGNEIEKNEKMASFCDTPASFIDSPPTEFLITSLLRLQSPQMFYRIFSQASLFLSSWVVDFRCANFDFYSVFFQNWNDFNANSKTQGVNKRFVTSGYPN